MRDAGYYRELVDAVMRPHLWLVCSDTAAGLTQGMRRWREQGYRRPLAVVGTAGTGDLPEPEDCDLVVLDTTGDTMMEGLRSFHRALRMLPPPVLDRITAWDPGSEARALVSFLDTAGRIAERPTWGARPESWLDLEDKTTIDEVWAAAGVAHASSRVVPATASAMRAAARVVGEGGPTVWAGDNREGWHGGAEYTRYVTDDDTAAIEFMSAHCDRVRVMPYLEGVPCSIHGMVFPEAVAAFRPVEMVVFRVPGSDRFRYASVATTWDPTPSVREEMRAAARRVGALLRSRHGYRGVFTIDGVVTASGWLPTELNPRFGAGLGPTARLADLPLVGLHRMLIAGEGESLDGDDIEALAVAASDATRHLGGMMVLPTRVDVTESIRAHWDGETVSIVGAEGGNATLERGPSASGGMVRFTLDPAAAVPGTLAAPVVAAAFTAADDHWGSGIGPLLPATAP